MRWLLRALAALVLLAGVVLGIVWPQAARHSDGPELGRWTLHVAGEGTPAEMSFSSPDVPVELTIVLRTRGPLRSGERGPLLTLAVQAPDGTSTATPLTFDGPGVTENPQLGTLVHEVRTAGPAAAGTYRLAVAIDDPSQADVQSVIAVARPAATKIDPRAEPVGYLLIAAGFIGLVLLRRRARRAAEPARPRWGRGA